jgi:hypothetical protein
MESHPKFFAKNAKNLGWGTRLAHANAPHGSAFKVEVQPHSYMVFTMK